MSESKDRSPDLTDALTGARSLLGWKLVHDTPEGRVAGFIVETEAYDMMDAASHAFGGEKVRNKPLFMNAGTIYVYFTYGMHYCFNIVTGGVGQGQGVLIRALEPTEGIEIMKARRKTESALNLCSGPAKLVQALGITKSDNGTSIFKNNISLQPGFKPTEVTEATRVGISKAKDILWRFYISDNPYISRR